VQERQRNGVDNIVLYKWLAKFGERGEADLPGSKLLDSSAMSTGRDERHHTNSDRSNCIEKCQFRRIPVVINELLHSQLNLKRVSTT